MRFDDGGNKLRLRVGLERVLMSNGVVSQIGYAQTMYLVDDMLNQVIGTITAQNKNEPF